MHQEPIEIVAYRPEYRRAVIALMAELQEVERSLSADRMPGEEVAEGHFDYLLGVCERQAGEVLVAFRDARVVGFVVVFVETEDEGDLHLLPEYRKYGWVSDLVVADEHKGSGTASRLMACAERYAAAAGARRMKLAALRNNGPARRFYERAGYSEHEIVYCKTLDETDAD